MNEISRLRNRPLTNEPLTAEDWRELYYLLAGFQAAVERVVKRARLRIR